MIIRPIIKRVFGEQYDFGVPAGNALLYLVRRFGYTAHGSDPHKEVCDYYMPSEKLNVIIHVGGRTAFFGVSMSKEMSDKLHQEMRLPEKPLMLECETAVEMVLKDLLRPVKVRDIYINILGEVKPQGEFDEEAEMYHNEAPRFHAAGYGVPDWYTDKNLFFDFVDAVEKFGGGSAEAGMKKAMGLMGATTLCK